MDYRERKYYLIRFGYYYNEELKILKEYVPSLKCHPPYNHYRKKKKVVNIANRYDGNYNGYYIQQLVSCRLSDVDGLMKFLNHYGNPEHRFYSEVTKEDLGQ